MMHFGKPNKPTTSSLNGGKAQDLADSDIKEHRKKLRNRESAQRARDRQKERMRWLEGEVRFLTLKNQTIQSENEALRSLLEDKVNEIRRQQQILATTRTHRPFDSTFPSAGEKTSSADEEKSSKINIPGKIHGTFRILNSEKEKIHGPIERVAVISPVARIKEKETRPRSSSSRRASPFAKDITNQFDAGDVKPKRQLPHQEDITVKNDTNAAQFDVATKRVKYSKPNEDVSISKDLGMGIDSQLMPLAAYFMGSPYAGYLPGIYPSSCGSSMAFVNFLPSLAIHKTARDEKTQQKESIQQTMNVLRDANTLSLLRARSYINSQGTVPSLQKEYLHTRPPLAKEYWNPLTMTISNQVENRYQSTGINGAEPKPEPKQGNLQRFKMNSFDSECSSTQTSESELPLQSP